MGPEGRRDGGESRRSVSAGGGGDGCRKCRAAPKDGNAKEKGSSQAAAPSDCTHPSLGSSFGLDAPLDAVGFQLDTVSSNLVSGRLTVTLTCCQPFGVLHGGISALIAEALASIGASVALGFKRAAGIQLSINHLKTAQAGDQILAQATPISVGKSIQVWEVGMWKVDPSGADAKGVKVASSRVTIFNLPVPETAAGWITKLKQHAKL